MDETAATSEHDRTAVTASGRRLAFLDVLRGMAALSVCVQHVLERYPAFREFSRDWFNFGTFGVVVFFLVSGFIIPASLEKHGSLRHFWRGRAFRLYPMYMVTLGIALALDVVRGAPVCPGSGHPALCVMANLTFLQEYARTWTIVSVAWTLSLEMVFYLLCSAMFAASLLYRRAAAANIVSGAVLLAVVVGAMLHHTVPIGRFGLLALCFEGMLLASIYKGREKVRALVPNGLLLAVALGVGFWTRSALHRADLNGEGFTFTSLCTSWAAGALLFGMLYAARAAAMPCVLQWLGRVSYSLYLLAWVMLGLGQHLVPGWAGTVLDVLLPIAVSGVTYRWIERPFISLAAAPVRSASATH